MQLKPQFEATRRVLIDEILVRRVLPRFRETTPSGPSIFYYLNRESLPIFEAAVENSYRYYTFFANLSFSMVFVLSTRRVMLGTFNTQDAALASVAAISAVAASIQYSYFGAFARDFVAAEARRTRGEQLAMLDNWPPPGTEVHTTRKIVTGDLTIPSGTRGRIKSVPASDGPERPDDRFFIKLYPPQLQHSYDMELKREDIR